jgi:hypothetical protein
MKTLNERYQYGLHLFLLSIDEGITGYRDDSLEVCTIKRITHAPVSTSYTDCETKSTTIRHAAENPFL